jgi:hypothetical protein
MGVPLAYMDFAPEPPAPTATPVITTEMNCNPSHDTKDLSRKFQDSLMLWNSFDFFFGFCSQSLM